jgi:hypothetical protein
VCTGTSVNSTTTSVGPTSAAELPLVDAGALAAVVAVALFCDVKKVAVTGRLCDVLRMTEDADDEVALVDIGDDGGGDGENTIWAVALDLAP